MEQSCNGTHRYFVADVAQVIAEGKVCIIVVCTACGLTHMTEHKVTGTLQRKEK